ncbi:MAG: TonB-dependent receptor [Vicinamibacterales bacterium]
MDERALSSRAVLDIAGSDAYGNNDQLPQPSVQPGDIPRYDAATRIHTVASAILQVPINPGWRANLNASVGISLANHDIKIGNEFIRSDVTRGSMSVTDPAGLSAIYRNGLPDSVNTYNTPNLSTGRILTDGIYAQDKWTPIDRITLSAGVRFEYARGWVNDGTSEYLPDGNHLHRRPVLPCGERCTELQGDRPQALDGLRRLRRGEDGVQSVGKPLSRADHDDLLRAHQPDLDGQ